MHFISFLLNVLFCHPFLSSPFLSLTACFFSRVKTEDDSSSILIKHNLIVWGTGSSKGKRQERGDPLPWKRQKKTEVEDKGDGESEQSKWKKEETKTKRGCENAVVVKSQLPCQMAQTPYLGNKKSDSLLRMPDRPVLVHFFNNMWPFFIPLETDGSCASATAVFKVRLHNRLEIDSTRTPWFPTPFFSLINCLDYPAIAGATSFRWCVCTAVSTYTGVCRLL